MRLLICAGGTGGGVYPALAVLRALQGGNFQKEGENGLANQKKKQDQPVEILWVGGTGGMEADLLKREDIRFTTIPAAGVHGVGMRALPGNLWQITKGIVAARWILKDFRPDVLFFTGGYLAIPVALAGRLPMRDMVRPKNLLFVPDIEPGLALKVVSRMADRIAVTTEESMGYFSNNNQISITGYPTRGGLRSWTAETARQALNLALHLPTLLVFGGSKGAHSINRALFSILSDLLQEMQIIHVTGRHEFEAVESVKLALERGLAERYHAFPYLHEEMGAALVASDLVVSRAGAAILGEYPLFGLPAILVPYPYAWRYQEVNARHLSSRGAAIVLADDELESKLLSTIRTLMRDRSRREAMQHNMQSLSRPMAAESIAELIHSLAPLPGLGRT